MAGWNKRHHLLLRWSIATSIIAGVLLAFSLINRTPDEEPVLPGEQVDGLTSVLGCNQPEAGSALTALGRSTNKRLLDYSKSCGHTRGGLRPLPGRVT